MKKKRENKRISLENAFSKLDKIVHDIEDDSIPLEKMIILFEEGMTLTEICNKKLKEAEKKIAILLNKDSSSN